MAPTSRRPAPAPTGAIDSGNPAAGSALGGETTLRASRGDAVLLARHGEATVSASHGTAALPASHGDAVLMRQALAAFAAAAAAGTLPLALPQRLGTAVARGEGHFHLTPELFLQVSGWTRFRFPQGPLLLRAGQALVVPPQLRHDERVGDDSAAGMRQGDGRAADIGAPARAFCNLVIRADGGQLTCHLAREQRGPGLPRGLPSIAHLHAGPSPLAPRLHDWLCDATLLGAPAGAGDWPPSGAAAGDWTLGGAAASHWPSSGAAATDWPSSGAAATDWPLVQARALLAAVLAGVLRTLDADAAATPTAREPALLARLQVLVQNQLGDHTLGVARLAEQSGCSADHLARLFRRARGEPLLVHVNRLRLDRAERLLRDTTLSVKEVAWACGYASAGYFIRQFRARSGCTPGQWRAGAGAGAGGAAAGV